MYRKCKHQLQYSTYYGIQDVKLVTREPFLSTARISLAISQCLLPVPPLFLRAQAMCFDFVVDQSARALQ